VVLVIKLNAFGLKLTTAIPNNFSICISWHERLLHAVKPLALNLLSAIIFPRKYCCLSVTPILRCPQLSTRNLILNGDKHLYRKREITLVPSRLLLQYTIHILQRHTLMTSYVWCDAKLHRNHCSFTFNQAIIRHARYAILCLSSTTVWFDTLISSSSIEEN
jgi:hypothetical protein